MIPKEEESGFLDVSLSLKSSMLLKIKQFMASSVHPTKTLEILTRHKLVGQNKSLKPPSLLSSSSSSFSSLSSSSSSLSSILKKRSIHGQAHRLLTSSATSSSSSSSSSHNLLPPSIYKNFQKRPSSFNLNPNHNSKYPQSQDVHVFKEQKQELPEYNLTGVRSAASTLDVVEGTRRKEIVVIPGHQEGHHNNLELFKQQINGHTEMGSDANKEVFLCNNTSTGTITVGIILACLFILRLFSL